MFESAISEKRASFVFKEIDTTFSLFPIRLPSMEMPPQSIPKNYKVSGAEIATYFMDK